jgi:PAS domain S-box-containing protein
MEANSRGGLTTDFPSRSSPLIWMSEIGQANPVIPPVAWATPEGSRLSPSGLKLPAVAVVLLVLLVGTVMVGGLWIHGSISHLLSQQFEGGPTILASDTSRRLKLLGHLQLAGTLFTSTCGMALIAFAVAGLRRVEAHWARIGAKQNENWDKITRELRIQLSERKDLDIARAEQFDEFKVRMERAEKAYATVKEELDGRKLADEVMSQQRRELTRSKDVLELHVQARAQQLQKLQRAYELILNSAGEGICGLDMEGKVTFANPTAARMLGVQVSEMVGRPATEVFPDFVQTGKPSSNPDGAQLPVEIITTRHDGTKFGAEVLRNPIREGDRTVGEVMMFKDITERKLAGEALARKADELARSNAELEQFAFVASHDLQEPLRKIQAFGDRLKAKCDEANLADGRDYLDRMQSAAARMQTLIFDLLTFSRVISRTEPFVPINLNQVVRDILSDLEVRIEKTGGRVEVDDLPTIEADVTQMRQLLQNLIGNALKFHVPGKPPVVRVSSKTLPVPATFSTTDGANDAPPPMCEITVADNGIGFDEKYLDKIFAVFQRLHGRQEYEGTGIGLAVCRRIVDRHGGNITARSTPGEGATFIITVPLKQNTKSRVTA